MAERTETKEVYRPGEGHPRAGAAVGVGAGHTASSSYDCGPSNVGDQALTVTRVTGKHEEKSDGCDSDVQITEVIPMEVSEKETKRLERNLGIRAGVKRSAKGRSKEVFEEDIKNKEIKKEVIEATERSGSDSDNRLREVKKKKEEEETEETGPRKENRKEEERKGEDSETEEEESEEDREEKSGNQTSEEEEVESVWDSSVGSEDYGKVWGGEKRVARELETQIEGFLEAVKECKKEERGRETEETDKIKEDRMRKKIWQEIDEEFEETEITDVNRTKHMIWQGKKIEYMIKESIELEKELEEYKKKEGGKRSSKEGKGGVDRNRQDFNKEKEEMQKKWNKDKKRMKEEWEKERRREREQMRKEIEDLKKEMETERGRVKSEILKERAKWTKMAEEFRKGKEQADKEMQQEKEKLRKINEKIKLEREREKEKVGKNLPWGYRIWRENLQEEADELKKERKKLDQEKEQLIKAKREMEREKKKGRVERMEVDTEVCKAQKEDKGIQTERMEVTYKDVLEKSRKGDREKNRTDGNKNKQRLEEEGNRKGQASRNRIRREALIIRTEKEEEGEEIMREFTAEWGDKEIGEEIRKVRRTKKGDLLIEMENRGETERVKEKIEEIAKDRATVVAKKPTMDVEIDDIEPYHGEQIVLEAMRKEFGERGRENEIRLKVLKKMGTGMKRAVFEIPMEWGRKIRERNVVRIGFVRCKMKEAQRVVRCFKCHDVGHLSYFCKRNEEGMEICRRCGDKGHNMTMCQAQITCHVCQKRGVPRNRLGHYAGTFRCVREKELMERKKGG